MTILNDDIVKELLAAMDTHNAVALFLIDKLIAETDQPDKMEIESGDYFYIQNTSLFNGQEILSDDWRFDVHGEHCRFENNTTGQVIEVALGDRDSVGDLDPYFFYHFLATTENLKHLAKYFDIPFHDTLAYFEALEEQGLLTRISRIQFRKR